MLKALFDERFIFQTPVTPSEDGATVTPHTGTPLMLGAELDKLATNVAMARNTAGVHWRSDSMAGLRLGEQVGLALLHDWATTPAESFDGFTLTTFDGATVRIPPGR